MHSLSVDPLVISQVTLAGPHRYFSGTAPDKYVMGIFCLHHADSRLIPPPRKL